MTNLAHLITSFLYHLGDILLGVYLGLAFLLALYTLGQLALLVQFMRQGAWVQPAVPLADYPQVTVQLPIYNERYVAERLLEAVAHLRYPAERLQIQVLDDSDDMTSAIIGQKVGVLRGRGVDVVHLQRQERTGYKAGALAYGLARAKGDYIAIFDADFVPMPDFLERTIGHMEQMPEVGMVQTRWGHLNADENALTRAQRLAVDAHFLVEQGGRARAGWLIPFNGTGGVWRRACIEDGGGWSWATLTEDFDLSYRAQLAGWRAAYLPDCVVPSELPAQLASYRQQQARWAMGSTQCLRRLLIPVWRAKHLSWGTRMMATHHLLQYVPQLLMIILLALTPPLLLSGHLARVSLAHLGLVGIIPPMLLALGQVIQAQSWGDMGRRLMGFPVLVMVATGTTYANGRAVWRALRGEQEAFHRTPKFAHLATRPTHPYRLRTLPYAETLGALYALGGVIIAYGTLPSLVPYLLVYVFSFGGVALWLWWDALQQALAQRTMLKLQYAHDGEEQTRDNRQNKSSSMGVGFGDDAGDAGSVPNANGNAGTRFDGYAERDDYAYEGDGIPCHGKPNAPGKHAVTTMRGGTARPTGGTRARSGDT